MRTKPTLVKLTLGPVLAMALWFSACSEQGTPAEQLLGPDQASFAKGGEGKAKGKGPKVKVKKGGSSEGYQLLTGVLPDRKDAHASEFIGPRGGELKASGHKLVVPAGAVNRPTEFSLRVFRKVVNENGPGVADNETVVGVDLRAVVYDTIVSVNEDGVEEIKIVETDVGPNGFLVPVHLSLTYDWAKSVPDEGALRILWVKRDGMAEVTPGSVDSSGKRVNASLWHFSDYAIGFPDTEETL